jgi:hypothetical protein
MDPMIVNDKFVNSGKEAVVAYLKASFCRKDERNSKTL